MVEFKAHTEKLQLFKSLMQKNRLASSYLFYGPSGCGKWKTAVEIAAMVLGEGDTNSEERVRKFNHPDLNLVYPMPTPKKVDEKDEFVKHFMDSKRKYPYLPVKYDGRVINILKEMVRDFQKYLYKIPMESTYRAAIIERAEMMPSTSFDILLKTIEEPPPNSLLILLTDNPDRLPDTIRSRCQRIRFKRLSSQEIKKYLVEEKVVDKKKLDLITNLSFGSLSRAESLSEWEFSEDRDSSFLTISNLFNKPIDEFWYEFTKNHNFRNKEEFESLLIMWQILYHDLSLVCAGANHDKLINKDKTEELTALAKQVGSFENAKTGMNNLLAVQKLMYRNLTLETTFFNLASRLKNHTKALEIRE